MRARTLTAVAAICLSAILGSAQAAPPAPHGAPAEALQVTPVAGGCGPGFHRHAWRGPYGRWHVECVPNRPVVGYRACPPGMVLRTWRGPYGHWHRRCVPI
ncbi:MAG TPA: hypothetical protein VME41_08230 [Stellaceae bacterium]|nr:hypothetical protein [Stellaceae bacterium]